VKPLEAGDGANRLLYFDCFSGLAGDMIVGALIDLGVPLAVVESAVAALPISGFRLRTERVERQSIAATHFVVDVDGDRQPHRHYSEIRAMIEGAGLEPAVAELALEAFAAIAAAEARVHGSDVERVHFHEVGAVDSIADIVGAAAALHHVGARVVSAPVPLGRGFVETRHGTLPVPAPATVLILEGVPVHGTEVEAELTTPTGAALIKAAASEFGPVPPMTLRRIGFGAGTREPEGRPGLLRVVLGTPRGRGLVDDSCWVVESNIDDVTGEVAAHALVRLLEAGALDAWIEPIQMKKGRPAIKLSMLCRRDDLERLAAELLRETPTIGLRHYPVGRIEMERRVLEVETKYGPIRVKLSSGPLGSVNAAPEFEDCRRAAQEHNVPLKQVMALAAGLAQGVIDESQGD
jgi:uncharacterized protein (TIGR00299 family) protein